MSSDTLSSQILYWYLCVPLCFSWSASWDWSFRHTAVCRSCTLWNYYYNPIMCVCGLCFNKHHLLLSVLFHATRWELTAWRPTFTPFTLSHTLPFIYDTSCCSRPCSSPYTLVQNECVMKTLVTVKSCVVKSVCLTFLRLSSLSMLNSLIFQISVLPLGTQTRRYQKNDEMMKCSWWKSSLRSCHY